MASNTFSVTNDLNGTLKGIFVLGLNGFGKFCARLKCVGKSAESFSTDVTISDNGLFHTAPPRVPANKFEPETAREYTAVYVNPKLTALQLLPLLEERNTPLAVPAKRVVPETARA